MKILNIHGYKGSAENSACLALKNLGFDVIAPQIDYDAENPDIILTNLKDIAVKSEPDYIAGTSLGGFFAMLVAEYMNIPAVLVNPCLKPQITLPELDYKLNKLRKQEFESFEDMIKKMNCNNMTAVIGGEDDVIDYHETVTKKIISNCIVIPEGKHSGATLPLKELFGEIIK